MFFWDLVWIFGGLGWEGLTLSFAAFWLSQVSGEWNFNSVFVFWLGTHTDGHIATYWYVLKQTSNRPSHRPHKQCAICDTAGLWIAKYFRWI